MLVLEMEKKNKKKIVQELLQIENNIYTLNAKLETLNELEALNNKL